MYVSPGSKQGVQLSEMYTGGVCNCAVIWTRTSAIGHWIGVYLFDLCQCVTTGNNRQLQQLSAKSGHLAALCTAHTGHTRPPISLHKGSNTHLLHMLSDPGASAEEGRSCLRHQLMNPLERFSRPPQNTPVDPRMNTQGFHRYPPQTEIFPPSSTTSMEQTSKVLPYTQPLPQAIPRPLAPVHQHQPPPRTPQQKRTFLNHTPTSAQWVRKPRLKIDHGVDMCILKHVLSYKPYCYANRAVSRVWEGIRLAIADEMPSLVGGLSVGSIKYRYKRLMEDHKLFCEESLRRAVEERGSATKKRRLYDYEQLEGDIKDMCQTINEDMKTNNVVVVHSKGKEAEEDEEEEEGEEGTGDEKELAEEEDHVSPVGYSIEEDITMRSNNSSKTNISASFGSNINMSRSKSMSSIVSQKKTSSSATSVRFPLDATSSTSQGHTPQMEMNHRGPTNEQHHDQILQLQRQFVAEQKRKNDIQDRRNDLLEEDLKWKWEFLTVLKQRNNEIDDGTVLMMLGKGAGET